MKEFSTLCHGELYLMIKESLTFRIYFLQCFLDSHILGAFVGLDKCSRFSTLGFVTIDISLDAAVEPK